MLRENNYKILQPKISYPTKIAFKVQVNGNFQTSHQYEVYLLQPLKELQRKTLANQKINSQKDKVKEKNNFYKFSKYNYWLQKIIKIMFDV